VKQATRACLASLLPDVELRGNKHYYIEAQRATATEYWTPLVWRGVEVPEDVLKWAAVGSGGYTVSQDVKLRYEELEEPVNDERVALLWMNDEYTFKHASARTQALLRNDGQPGYARSTVHVQRLIFVFSSGDLEIVWKATRTTQMRYYDLFLPCESLGPESRIKLSHLSRKTPRNCVFAHHLADYIVNEKFWRELLAHTHQDYSAFANYQHDHQVHVLTAFHCGVYRILRSDASRWAQNEGNVLERGSNAGWNIHGLTVNQHRDLDQAARVARAVAANPALDAVVAALRKKHAISYAKKQIADGEAALTELT
jgi:hypothetical protein